MTAIFSAIALQVQGRRHFFERKLEYERLGREMPLPAPKIPMLEAVLTIVVGIFLFAGGVVMTVVIFKMPESMLYGNTVVSASVMVAGGVALVVLGARAMKENGTYMRRMQV